MADLRNRIDMEGSAAARLERLAAQHRQLLMAAMGNPIDVDAVPDSFWKQVEADRRAQLELIGYLVYVTQARDHGASVSRAQDMADRYVPKAAAQVAADSTAHSRSLMRRHAPTGEARVQQLDTLRFAVALKVFPPSASEATARTYVAQIAGRAAEDTSSNLPIVLFALSGVSLTFLMRLLARTLRSTTLARSLQSLWVTKDGVHLALDRIPEGALDQARDAIPREIADILLGTTADDLALARRLRQIARKRGIPVESIADDVQPNIIDGYQSDQDLWFTMLDGHVCKICQPLHRTKRPVWAPAFPQGPPAHHRCRCWIQYANQRFLRVPQGA